MFETDVFVIGGGPAGLAAAIAAAHKGLRVVVADGKAPPIDKACGEGLMPDSRRAAAELGVVLPDSAGYEFRGIRFVGESAEVEGDFPSGRGLGLRRPLLHQRLVEVAERAGVDLRWDQPVTDLSQVKARWVIGADGPMSRVRRWAGLESWLFRSRRFAFRQHFAVAPWTDRVEVHWGEGRQAYVTPVGAEQVCVVVTAAQQGTRMLEAIERHFPKLRERLLGAAPASAERGAVTGGARLRQVRRENVALIGDASGSVDAITGEGLCLIFRQAAVLAEALAAGDLGIYERAHPRLALRSHLMARAMLLLDKGGRRMREAALRAMAWQPWVFGKMLAVHVS